MRVAGAVVFGVAMFVLGFAGCDRATRSEGDKDNNGRTLERPDPVEEEREQRQAACRRAIDRVQAPFQSGVTYIRRPGFPRHEEWIDETIRSSWDETNVVDEHDGSNGALYRYYVNITLAGKTGPAADAPETIYGTLIVELLGIHSPDLVRHFLVLARSGFYRGRPMRSHPEAPELPFVGTAFGDDPYVFKAQRNLSPPPRPGSDAPLPRGSLLALHEGVAGTADAGGLLATKLFLNPYGDIDEDWPMREPPVIFGFAKESAMDADGHSISAKEIMARLARGMEDENTSVFIKETRIARQAEVLRATSSPCPPELLRIGALAGSAEIDDAGDEETALP